MLYLINKTTAGKMCFKTTDHYQGPVWLEKCRNILLLLRYEDKMFVWSMKSDQKWYNLNVTFAVKYVFIFHFSRPMRMQGDNTQAAVSACPEEDSCHICSIPAALNLIINVITWISQLQEKRFPLISTLQAINFYKPAWPPRLFLRFSGSQLSGRWSITN